MKRLLPMLLVFLLLLTGCTASPEADYMAPVRAYCRALQDNDFSQLQQAMPAAVLSSMHSSTAQRWPCGAALQSSFPLILTIPFSLHCFMQNAMGYLLLREIKLLPLFYLI